MGMHRLSGSSVGQGFCKCKLLAGIGVQLASAVPGRLWHGRELKDGTCLPFERRVRAPRAAAGRAPAQHRPL